MTAEPEPLCIAANLVAMTRFFVTNGHEHLETLPRAALTDPRVREHWTRVMNHLGAARLGLDELGELLDTLARHHAGEDAARPGPGPGPEDAP